MERLFIPIVRMQFLQELGLDTSKATFQWIRVNEASRDRAFLPGGSSKWRICLANLPQKECNEYLDRIPTFSLQEALEMLPEYELTLVDGYHVLTIGDDRFFSSVKEGIMEAIFYALEWALKNNKINLIKEK